jgi:hypothetical protein
VSRLAPAWLVSATLMGCPLTAGKGLSQHASIVGNALHNVAGVLVTNTRVVCERSTPSCFLCLACCGDLIL